jgi:hypothetical protein
MLSLILELELMKLHVKEQKLTTINLISGHAITGKPNSMHDAEFECGPEDRK